MGDEEASCSPAKPVESVREEKEDKERDRERRKGGGVSGQHGESTLLREDGAEEGVMDSGGGPDFSSLHPAARSWELASSAETSR